MIKAMFFDLDGTLLNSRKEISRQTRIALEECRARGIKLFTATARPPLLERMLSWAGDTLSLFDGGVYYNGGCIITGGNKEYQFVDDEIVRKTIKHICEHEALNIALQLEDERHAFRFPLEDVGYKSWGVERAEAFTLRQAENLKAVKLLVFYNNLIDSMTKIDDGLIFILEELCKGSAQFYFTDNGKCVQITGQHINKMRGIEKIREFWGFKKNEIAVFGDDVNDIEMLSEYEYSVAMGNAEKIVKDSAKYVTSDNDSDGVSFAVKNFLFCV